MTGVPVPGARFSPDKSQVVFSLWSPQATRVEVWVYAVPMDAPAILQIQLLRQADRTLSSTVNVADLMARGLAAAIYYGYRAWGPNWLFDVAWMPGSIAGFVTDVDPAGNRFNPNKLLLDPYALEVSHDPMTVNHP